MRNHLGRNNVPGGQVARSRTAVGYVRVSTDMQAFDRLSRSIKHFCELYETHFADGTKHLVAIREAIRLDSALGRALVSILRVFAQMERESCGERVKEAIGHIRGNGYHFGKAPYGSKAVPSPENPRYRILVDDPDEQIVLSRINSTIEARVSYRKIAAPAPARSFSGLMWSLRPLRGAAMWYPKWPRSAV